jgi:hypothetical protein
LNINENQDWANPSLTDFSGTFYVMGEKYSGVPINPQEPLEIQELQTMLAQLQSQLPAGSGVVTSNDQSQSVPEPSTFALLGVGTIGLGFTYWRKRR